MTNFTNLKTLENQILEFLEDFTPEVMAIKGDWGVGKTYAWSNTLKKCKNKIHKDFKNYSYVSLFGIESIDKLKAAIFEKMVPKEKIGEEPSAITLKDNLIKIDNLYKEDNAKPAEAVGSILGFGMVGKAIDAGLGYLAGQALSNLSIEKDIICLDDLERTNLDAKEVLGVISELNEKKKCKVVLILNEEKLPISELKEEKNCKVALIFDKERLSDIIDPTKEEQEKLIEDTDYVKTPYEKYREKVINIEIKFSPTTEECAKIRFGGKEKFIPDAKILKKRCCQLGITNIRIMNKIIRLWEKISPYFDGENDETKTRFILPLVLITSAYCKGKDMPSFKYIKDGEYLNPLRLSDNRSEEETEWGEKIDEFKVSSGSSLTNMILKYVENGYITQEEIRKELNNYDEIIKRDRAYVAYHNSWRIFHDSFHDSKKELVNSIYKTGEECIINYIIPLHNSIRSLNILISLFRRIGENEKADELIEKYIKKVKLDFSDYYKELKEELESPTPHDNWDNVLEEKINIFYEDAKPKITLDSILKNIHFHKTFTDDEKQVLNATSCEDFYTFFTTAEFENMRECAERCLHIPNGFKALDRIRCDGTLLNKYRVENLTGWEDTKEYHKKNFKIGAGGGT